MKKLVAILVLSAFFIAFPQQKKDKKQSTKINKAKKVLVLNSMSDKISYAIGLDLGNSLKQQQFPSNNLKPLFIGIKENYKQETDSTLKGKKVKVKTEKSKIKTHSDSVSYAMGLNIGNIIQMQQIELANLELFFQGIEDVLKGNEPALSQAELNSVFEALEEQQMMKQNPNFAKEAIKNKEEGAKFLTENKLRKEVKTTATGLQYEVLATNDTCKTYPKSTDKVRVHYKGTLINGDEFDSSYKRNEPTEFPLNAVIKGWTEGLQLMKVGEKFKFYIPSDLAYGKKGAGGTIGPNATLVFEVELLGIVK